MPIGQIIGGDYGDIWIRQKSGKTIEIGDLLSIDDIILQVTDLSYGSLLEDDELARMSGMELEGYEETSVMEEEVRNYINAKAKPLVHVKDGDPKIPKTLPNFFGQLERVNKKDFYFMEKPANSLYLGKVRSGSHVLDVPVHVNGKEVLSHHILIPATTGRGKSNLVKVMLWNLIPEDYCGMLIIDPHDEYYGRFEEGAKDHPEASKKIMYYSVDPPKGGYQLRFNLSILRPWDLRGVVEFTGAQREALDVFFSRHGKRWLEELLLTDEDEAGAYRINESTLNVLKRKLCRAFDLRIKDDEIRTTGSIFTTEGGESIVSDMVKAIEDSKKVILDTSSLPQNKELMIAGIVTKRIFSRYKSYKEKGELEDKPTVSIVIEEAPRVLGEKADRNIFHDIAREGRKFRVGLVAITQLASMIPREILANMNTKIILGNEMKREREAIIGSAAQDLSKDSKNIASLDKGEAIVSSIFTNFAVPIQIDLFDQLLEDKEEDNKSLEFFG